MINLERNGRVIAEDITAFEAFVKLALIDNFVFNDELSEQQLDEINEVYYELSNLDLNIGELDYLIYNITHIETLNDFLRVLVNHPDYILELITNIKADYILELITNR